MNLWREKKNILSKQQQYARAIMGEKECFLHNCGQCVPRILPYSIPHTCVCRRHRHGETSHTEGCFCQFLIIIIYFIFYLKW